MQAQNSPDTLSNSESRHLRPRQLLLLGLILLTLGLAWRVERWGLNAPLWGDEAYIGNNLLVRDYHTILLPPLEHNQVAPPLFLMLELFISRTLGFSELVLRLPALLAGVVGLLLFAWFVRRNLSPRSAVLALGFLAASYYAARHASEVKPYSSDLAISLGLTMLAWNIHRGMRTEGVAPAGPAGEPCTAGHSAPTAEGGCPTTAGGSTPATAEGGCPTTAGGSTPATAEGGCPTTAEGSTRPTAEGGCPASQISWAGLIVLGGLAVWLSLPSIFVLGGVGVFLLVSILRRRRWAGLVPLALFGAVVLGCFAWQYVLYLRPMQHATANFYQAYWEKAFPPLSQAWKIPLWLLEIHAGNMMAYPVGGARFASAGTLLLVIAGAISLCKSKKQDLLLLLLAPLGLALLAACAKKYPYGMSARTMLFMAPAFCLLAGEGLGWLLSRLLKARVDVGVVVATCVLGGIALAGMAMEVSERHVGKADILMRSTFADLARDGRPDDQWIFINSSPTEVEKLIAPKQLAAVTLPGRLTWSENYGEPLDGDGAEVFRFYAARSANVDNRWGPMPADISPITGRTFLISFHSADEKRQPPDTNDPRSAKEKDYVATLAQRLGEPMERQILLPRRKNKPPSAMMFIYEFGPGVGRI